MIDTIRIILFTQCNLSCSYCCNEIDSVNSNFVKVWFDDIAFSLYKNVCLTGGEPFLDKTKLYSLLRRIPRDKDIFIYTNGLLISELDVLRIETNYKNVKGLNIGLHSYPQLKKVIPGIENRLNVRFMVQDTKLEKMLQLYPDRLTKQNTKGWKLNQCEMSNEKWVILND